MQRYGYLIAKKNRYLLAVNHTYPLISKLQLPHCPALMQLFDYKSSLKELTWSSLLFICNHGYIIATPQLNTLKRYI